VLLDLDLAATSSILLPTTLQKRKYSLVSFLVLRYKVINHKQAQAQEAAHNQAAMAYQQAA
jgi:hypothetical protein